MKDPLVWNARGFLWEKRGKLDIKCQIRNMSNELLP